MTIDEYKAEYPQDAVFIQVDDTERTMTDEEYEAWVVEVFNTSMTTRPNHENAGDTDRSIRRRMDMDMDMSLNPSKARSHLVGLICMTVLIASRRNRTRPRVTDHHNDCGLLSRQRHGRTI
jgi:hypothetical protein